LSWTVVGAGPAGIAAVGKLLDEGVAPSDLGWIDTHFEVGDFGRKWKHVPSNTRVELFLRFLENFQSFSYDRNLKRFDLDTVNPADNCKLKLAVDSLQWVTENLREKVHCFTDEALSLKLHKNRWELTLRGSKIYSKNVILATGAEPKTLDLKGPTEIALEVALDPALLSKEVNEKDTIGVFGSSHSAVLILANLLSLNRNNIEVINFYRSTHLYAVPMDGWILFDNTGLKGYAANWARKYLDGENPPNLKRLLCSDPLFETALSSCNKAVYAVGFKNRTLPHIEGFGNTTYNDKTGIIAPGLFGVGIGFPQAQVDPFLNLEYRVGLWKFADYLNCIIPIWFKYSN